MSYFTNTGTKKIKSVRVPIMDTHDKPWEAWTSHYWCLSVCVWFTTGG